MLGWYLIQTLHLSSVSQPYLYREKVMVTGEGEYVLPDAAAKDMVTLCIGPLYLLRSPAAGENLLACCSTMAGRISQPVLFFH